MVLLLLPLFASSVRAAPEIEFTFEEEVDPKLQEIASFMHYEVIQAWHHSGDRWSNEKLGITVDDSKLGGDLRLLQEYLIPDTGYPFEFNLPYEVIKAIGEGKKVVVKAESAHPGINIGQFMNYIDEPEKYPATISGNKMKIMMHPYFNYERDPIIGTNLLGHLQAGFEIGLNIPFVKQMYGMNTYSVFGNGLYEKPMASTFTSGINNDRGELHFSRINPKTGAIYPGYTLEITNTGQMVSSSGLRVGQSEGVFRSSGAFGLSFHYPINFRFYVEGEGKSDMILTEFELVEKSTGKVIDSFKRSIDPTDPFNPYKQAITRISTTVTKSRTVKPGEDYTVRAKYQFISFAEGAFDITNPASMTPEQRALTTEVNRNQFKFL
jgi:hypothetical protein